MPTVLPVSKTIQNPPYMHGRQIAWSLKAGEAGELEFVPPYKKLSVSVSGDLAGASIGFSGALGIEAAAVVYADPLTPFYLRKPGIYEVPLALSKLAPCVIGGTDETQAIITIFLSEGI